MLCRPNFAISIDEATLATMRDHPFFIYIVASIKGVLYIGMGILLIKS